MSSRKISTYDTMWWAPSPCIPSTYQFIPTTVIADKIPHSLVIRPLVSLVVRNVAHFDELRICPEAATV